MNRLLIWLRICKPKPKLPRIGQYCIWITQDQLMWPEARRIVHIEEYQGKHYCWVDGSMTAIPADELKLEL